MTPADLRDLRAWAKAAGDLRLVVACDRALHWGDLTMVERLTKGDR